MTRRNSAFPPPKVISNGDGEDVELQTRWEICGTCKGNGKHSLHIDGQGLTSDDLREWDDEEFEFYRRGGYDKTCDDCDGSGKVPVVDESVLSPEMKKLWEAWLEDQRQYRAMVEMERRMGA